MRSINIAPSDGVSKGVQKTKKPERPQTTENKEECFATPSRSDGSTSTGSKKGRPGRKRRARSMGRYPFLTCATKYLENSGLAESTLIERKRRLWRIHRDLYHLRAGEVITTTNPEKMTEKEVGAFVELMIERGKKGKDFEHDVTALGALLKFANNLALESYRNRHANQFRKCTRTIRHPPLDSDEYGRIVQGTSKVDANDWNKMESYAIVVLGLASGARHKELREGRVEDLCLRDGDEHYHIAHPKGEATYGEERDPPIRLECLTFLRKYLQKRKEMLAKRPDNEFLFPAFRDKVDGKLSANSITKMVRSVGRDAQVVGLDLHKCRRTYGQMLLDEGASIEEVSVLMGHASTAMTEKYYCRRRHQQAAGSARNLWGRNVLYPTLQTQPDAKTPLIDEKYEDTGYAY